MNALLRERIDKKPLHSHPPVPLARTVLTPPPESRARPDLPGEPPDAKRHQGEEHGSHPRRDIAEDFAGCVIYIVHRKGAGTWARFSFPASSTILAAADRFDQLWHNLMQVAHQTVSRH